MLFSTNKPHNSLLLARLAYWPDRMIGNETRKHIVYQRWMFREKGLFLTMLSADQSILITSAGEYKINWAYNQIPSETEWNKRSDHDVLKIELRTSHLLGGKVAIIEWASHKKVQA